MPERIYMNRREGERRIHIEIDESEISSILDDLIVTSGSPFAAKQFREVLIKAQNDFNRT